MSREVEELTHRLFTDERLSSIAEALMTCRVCIVNFEWTHALWDTVWTLASSNDNAVSAWLFRTPVDVLSLY